MYKKFEEYMNSIGLTSTTIQKRIEEIIQNCSKICPEPFEDIFIEDYIQKDGTREYTSINLYSKNYCISANNFKTDDKFTIARIAKEYCGVEIEMNSYDFKNANEKSRLIVHAPTGSDYYTEYKASHENCDRLRNIIIKYIIPNLKD